MKGIIRLTDSNGRSHKWLHALVISIAVAGWPLSVMASCEEVAEVVITAPTDGTVVTAPATRTITAQVTGPICSGRVVYFMVNGNTFLYTDTAAPWSYTWSNIAPGTYSLSAIVQDRAGESSSAPVALYVNNPISISLTSPGSGTVTLAPATFTLNATATDTAGTITKVEFYANGSLINTDSSAPYSFTYSGVGAGSYALTARATDSNGYTATSAAVNVVSNAVPSVSLTGPGNGASALAPATFTLSANASDSDGTISKVEFYSNGTLVNTDTGAPYSYNYAGLGSGSYTITAKAYDNRNAVTTSGASTVTVNAAPSISLTSPANGASGIAPATFTLSADASDSDGSISKVEFYSNGTLVNTDAGAPYSYSYPGLGSGTYTITAKAYDNLGAVVTSGAATVSVNAAPTVSLTSPSNGATGIAPASFTLTATANDSDGSVSKVEFYSNGSLVNTDTASPYTYVYPGLGSGSYAITAKAYDNLNAVTTSSAVNVSVNSAPSVSLTAPSNGASALAPASFTLTATASDSDGSISKVEFYSNGALINTDTVAPYSYAYTNLAVGNYALIAKAVDNLSAVTASATANVSVVPNGAPTVYITAPVDGAVVLAPAMLSITANASDSDGSISKVEFYSNGTLISTDTVAPYAYSYPGLGSGTYALTAKAYDDLNVVTTSGAVNVTVNAAPSVSLTSPSNGASGVAPAIFTLAATASDSDGSISKVEFYSNGSLVDSDTTAPYSTSYTGVGSGSYTITAKAYDNRNAVTTSGGVAISVNAAPTVSLSTPSNGATGTAPAIFTVTATANDSDGSVAKVEFFTNGALFATDTTSPYSVSLANLGAGTYALTAKSTDNLGQASVLSNSATVTVSGSGALSVTRTYVYDAYERLCKTIEPESGATIVDYDGAGNVAWSVQGSNLTSATCDRASVAAATKIVRGYDARNRVLNVSTLGAAADIATTYFPDGAVASISANNPSAGPVLTQYSYNKRRMLMSESVEESSPSLLFTTTYTYNSNGHLSSLKYPDLQVVDYLPDALGRPTQVGTYATGISYYPNGAIQQFTYGNGVVHTMTQNARRLPARSRDVKGATVVLDDTYDFDENGNVTDITDQAQGGLTTRGMGYDELDRLTAAVAPGLWGNASFGYDGLDNLASVDQGVRHYRYSYSSNRRLAQINDPNGVPQITLGYDAAGNVTNKNGQPLVFDPSNRLNEVTGIQYYRYDGLGRRVQTTDQDGKYTFWQYSQAGQVLYASEARKSRNTAYIYLGNTQLAARHVAWGSGTITVDYQHTDALGSPVAETNASGAVTVRHSYTPYGEAFNAPIDGPGYTGHVMDAATGLTYMQQRYYDPLIGRFLSVDPVTADGNTGGNFNRYWYANNNSYKFTDPDGRMGYLVDYSVQRDALVIPVYFTGSAATPGNIQAIMREFSKLAVDPMANMRLVLQVLDKPGAPGTYNKLDISPGYWKSINGQPLQFGEGVDDNSGHINSSSAGWMKAVVHDILHFPGMPDGYKDLPGSVTGNRKSQILPGYTSKEIMADRAGNNVTKKDADAARNNQTTVIIQPVSHVAGPGGTTSSLRFDP